MIRLHYKLLLAAASGTACGFIYLFIDGEPGGAFPSWHWAVSIIVPGTLFGTAVLFPYLRRDRWLYLRAIGLIAISTFSYRSAIVVAVDSNILDASVVGAGIVVLGAMIIAPLRLTFAHIVTGLSAGVVPGIYRRYESAAF